MLHDNSREVFHTCLTKIRKYSTVCFSLKNILVVYVQRVGGLIPEDRRTYYNCYNDNGNSELEISGQRQITEGECF